MVQIRRGTWPQLCALQRKKSGLCLVALHHSFLSIKRGLFTQETLKGEGNVMNFRDLLSLKHLDTHLSISLMYFFYLMCLLPLRCQSRAWRTEFLSRSHCFGVSNSSPEKGPVTNSELSPGSTTTKTWHGSQQGFHVRGCFYLQFFLQCITIGSGLPLISR